MTMDQSLSHHDDSSGSTHSSSSRTHFRRKWMGTLCVLVTIEVLAAIGFIGYLVGRPANLSGPRISVSATGTIKAAPDTADFQFSVHTTASKSLTAFNLNAAKMNRLTQVLLRFVGHRDLQTTGLNSYQNFTYYGRANGWSVDNTLNVTLHKVSAVGTAIAAAVNAGGNGVVFNGVTFSITHTDALNHQARILAMHHAALKASQLAQAGGTSIGSIINISDQESSYSPTYFGGNSFDYVKYAASAQVPIQAGTQSVSVAVTVIYSLSS